MRGRHLWRVALAWCAVGCAARGPAPDASFRAMQVDEATVAQNQRALSQTCTEGAAARICEASRSLCERSQKLDDRDATARCLHANDACVSAREHVRTTCATHAP